MDKNRFFKEYAFRLAFLLATLAFFLFFPACLSKSAAVRTLMTILIFLLLAAGVALMYLGNKSRATLVHYFLYDRRRDKFLLPEELTVDIVQDGVTHYLYPYTKAPIELWQDIPRPLRVQLEVEPDFRPLMAYRMLFELSVANAENVSALFLSANEKALAYLCRTLSDCGDGEMADFIYDLYKTTTPNNEQIYLFFKNNSALFQRRALRYVQQNEEGFYVEKSRFTGRSR